MKRSFAVACVLALTLALGLSTSAGAGTSAETSAKSAKGKSCKGKGKKPKAGKSTATAQAKKKGKSKGCKAKGKAKGTAGLSDGTYGDAAKSLELNVSGGATTVVLKYVPPGFCAGITYVSEPVPLAKSGDTWTASETRTFSLVGESAKVKWDLSVKEPGLTYALNLTLESDTMIGTCKGEGHPTGTLTKVG